MQINLSAQDLRIQNLTATTISLIKKSDHLFTKFFNINKGFVDECVLAATCRDKASPDYDDYFQIASMGLWRALDKYNPDRASFSTYAYTLMHNDIFQATRKWYKQRHIIKNKEGAFEYREIDLDTIADNTSTGSNGYSTSHFDYEGSKENYLYLHIQLSNNCFEDNLLTQLVIQERLQKFSEFEQKVYSLKYKEKKTMKQIADALQMDKTTFKNMFYKRLKRKFDSLAV